MRIAVEGCCHGELDKIYETVIELEHQNGFKIDLLIICGDFQAVRNFDDLQAMAVPPKYQQLNTFYKYYNREKVAPVLTVFIGGNHEASNYMQELPYGGWVAPNIYYMGYAGVIQVGGLRIGGISGIFKGHDFNRGHHEKPPYEQDTKRSVYHIRNLEVFRLKQISRPVDIFISHDWPKGIYHHGDVAALVRRKPFFQKEIEENKLGSRPLSDLLSHLQPHYWFAAHLHVKFAAHVQHQSKEEIQPGKCTKFLALDKCLPRRNFLQVLELPHNDGEGVKIKLDPEWLTIVQNTDHLLNLTSANIFMPGPGCPTRFDFTVTDVEIEKTLEAFGRDMTLPENFVQTAPPLMGNPGATARHKRLPLTVRVNPQTTLLCSMLSITDPNAKFIGKTSQELLDESSIGLVEDADSSGDDVVYDSDEDEMPSTIDSSMDISSTMGPANSISKLDSFQTANEIFDSSDLKQLELSSAITSTPAKDSCGKRFTLDMDVLDDDDEFLSILSAQKSGNQNSSSQAAVSILPNLATSPFPHHPDSSVPCSQSDQLKATSHIDFKNASPPPSDSFMSPENQNSASLSDNQPVTLKAERSSFGMSGLCLSPADASSSTPSSELTPAISKKRGSPGHASSADIVGSEVMATNNSAVKKLKRRNISLYSEPAE